MTDLPVKVSEVVESGGAPATSTGGFVDYILRLRQTPAARSALRRAGSGVTEYRSYGYLAPWWTDQPYLRPAYCAFAGLAASVPGLAQDGNMPLGAMAAGLVRVGGMSENGVERKLLVAQTAGLPQLVSLLRPLLRAADRAGLRVDYQDLYWLLRTAEHPDRSKRTRSRQRLLESFYQALHPLEASTPTKADSTPTSAPTAQPSSPTKEKT